MNLFSRFINNKKKNGKKYPDKVGRGPVRQILKKFW